jgi:hypothetical protein
MRGDVWNFNHPSAGAKAPASTLFLLRYFSNEEVAIAKAIVKECKRV